MLNKCEDRSLEPQNAGKCPMGVVVGSQFYYSEGRDGGSLKQAGSRTTGLIDSPLGLERWVRG